MYLSSWVLTFPIDFTNGAPLIYSGPFMTLTVSPLHMLDPQSDCGVWGVSLHSHLINLKQWLDKFECGIESPTV